MEETKTEAGQLSQLETTLSSLLVMGVQEVMSVQCSLEVQAGEARPTERGAAPKSAHGALIFLRAPEFSGSAALLFPEASYLTLMGRLLGEEIPTYRDDLLDGAGELLNMVFGITKRILNENGFSLEPAIPIVVRGHEIELRTLPPGREIAIPFLSACGEFQVLLGVNEIKQEPV